MAVGHLCLRKIILLVIFVLLVAGVVAGSIFSNLDVYKIVGLSIIAVILFFNISRRIYPARRILMGSDDEEEKSEEQSKSDEKPAE